jgi:hypothetical protein
MDLPCPNRDDWHVPLARDHLTLGEALADMRRSGDRQEDVPLLVQLVENPRFQVPGFQLFHGAVDLRTHDCIHLVLGRGMRPKDEAFVIGFTMGSTHRVGTAEETLYTLIARHLYPGVYRFGPEEIAVFRDALRLGFVSGCAALDTFDYAPHMDEPLRQVRAAAGVETDLLRAYYAIEGRRYPHSPESRRLLDG